VHGLCRNRFFRIGKASTLLTAPRSVGDLSVINLKPIVSQSTIFSMRKLQFCVSVFYCANTKIDYFPNVSSLEQCRLCWPHFFLNQLFWPSGATSRYSYCSRPCHVRFTNAQLAPTKTARHRAAMWKQGQDAALHPSATLPELHDFSAFLHSQLSS